MTSISEQLPAHADLPARLPIEPTIGLMLISVTISTIFGLLGAFALSETWAIAAIIMVRICKITVQLLVCGAFVVGINDGEKESCGSIVGLVHEASV